MDAHRNLVLSVTRELLQAERSASRHCRVEADRLGESPPATAMRAVAVHADAALGHLETLLPEHGLPASKVGQAVGSAFSALRTGFADVFVDVQRSYRGTMLGIHHGVDTMRIFREVVARDPERNALVAFCDAWLERRIALAEACADELAWFADHPEEAVAGAGTSSLRRRFRWPFGGHLQEAGP